MTTDAELKLLGRIVTEPGKMGGKPIIRGRRITPAMVLNMLANGATHEQVLDAYPVLERADIDACLLYAARLSERSQSDGPSMAAEQVRLLADSNIVAAAVPVLRGAGHNVVFIGDRAEDPGDNAILEEAFASGRVLLTKDHDIGALVFRDKKEHAGVLLIDDLGSAQQEVELLTKILAAWDAVLLTGGFVRAGNWGSKRGAEDP